MAESNSSSLSLNGNDYKKLGVGLAIAVTGAIITYITEWISGASFGEATPLIVAGWSVVVNIIRKFIADKQPQEEPDDTVIDIEIEEDGDAEE